MKIENSFVGGCLFAIGYVSIPLFFWCINEVIDQVFNLLNIKTSGIEYFAYVLNGFSSNFQFFEFHIFIFKIIILNLLLFYLFAYLTEK